MSLAASHGPSPQHPHSHPLLFSHSLLLVLTDVPLLQALPPSPSRISFYRTSRATIGIHISRSCIQDLSVEPHQNPYHIIKHNCLLLYCPLSLLGCQLFEGKGPVLVNFKPLVYMTWLVLYKDCHREDVDKY